MGKPLTFSSPILRLAIDGEPSPYQEVVDYWLVRETFQPNAFRFDGRPYGAYQVFLEQELAEYEDRGSAYIYGHYLAQDIDHLCVYVTGLPLRNRTFDEFMQPLLPARGWATNAAEVLGPKEWGLLTSSTEWGTSPYRQHPELPLRAIVSALTAYRQADDLTFALATFHFEALTTTSRGGPSLFFAHAVEIIRALLPGRGPDAKQSQLPPAVVGQLRRPLNWLFGISNTRRSTRHPITKTPAVALHPDMAAEEESDFLHDADLLSRYVVATRLSLPTVGL